MKNMLLKNVKNINGYKNQQSIEQFYNEQIKIGKERKYCVMCYEEFAIEGMNLCQRCIDAIDELNNE